jgi:uncharacterized membrane protein YfcA
VSTAAAIILGFCAGGLSGTFGVGGAVLFVPAFTLFLGLSQLHAQATSLAAMLPVAAVGAWRHARKGNVRLRTAMTIGIASVAGVVLGAIAAENITAGNLRRLFAGFLFIVAIRFAKAAVTGKFSARASVRPK